MIYYDKARIDGLAKRHETTLELTDYFVNRDDFLEYRKAMFEPRPKKFGPADKDTNRPILVSKFILSIDIDFLPVRIRFSRLPNNTVEIQN